MNTQAKSVSSLCLNVEDMPKIRLIPIPHNRWYYTDRKGNIYSTKWGKLRQIKQESVNQYGYRHFTTTIDGKSNNHLSHRMVALTWIPNPDGKPHINHKNCIKTDNRIENLEWVTNAENIKHSMANGLHPKSPQRMKNI